MTPTTKENALERALEKCEEVLSRKGSIKELDYKIVSFSYGVNTAELAAVFNIRKQKEKTK